MSVNFKAFFGLILLTMLTVEVSYFDFGIAANVMISALVAAAQACLIFSLLIKVKKGDLGLGVKAVSGAAWAALVVLFIGGGSIFAPIQPEAKTDTAAAAVAATGAGGDQNKLRIATPDLVAKGKELFHTNACYTCHGETGQGNGIAAAGLNPKPRDFTSGYWKFGGAPTRVFHTITNGSPGTGMAPYGHLSVADRYALAHYVRSFHSPQPSDTEEDLKVAGLTGGGTGVAGPVEQPSMPIDAAMKKLEVAEVEVSETENAQAIDSDSSGGKIYRANCAGCHGVNGTGMKTMALGVNPSVALITASWSKSSAGWVKNSAEFEHVVMTGFPGRGMPGVASLSRSELGQLHSYVMELVSR